MTDNNQEPELLTVGYVAKLLGCHPRTIQRRFAKMDGVIDIGPGAEQRPRRGERQYRNLRIPRGVLNRFIYERSRRRG